ncbi:hypothetical protein MMC27_006794 [Xylographa pallens]|nr:hypothetical protein [Xylographa pallens]
MHLPHLLLLLSILLPPASPYYHNAPSPSSDLDARYAAPLTLYRSQRRLAVLALTHSYLTSMRDLGTTTWLAHDTLLSWRLGAPPLPGPVTMHVPLAQLAFLAAYYNMSVHGQYLLDIHPGYGARGGGEGGDARWVDMQSGLYVEVEGVREGWGEEGGPVLVAGGGREWERKAVVPLRGAAWGEEMVWVPRDVEAVLVGEYGAEAVRGKVFRG